MTYQIKTLGLVRGNLGTKHFFLILEAQKAQGGRGLGMKSEKSLFSHMARFAQGMQNVIVHIYFIYFCLTVTLNCVNFTQNRSIKHPGF